jgi:hypothetical protein
LFSHEKQGYNSFVVVPPALRFLTKVTTAATVVAVFATAVCLADTYRWTDKNGNVGFADSLQKVPQQYRESAKRLDGKSGGPSTKPLQIVPSLPQPDAGVPPADAEDTYATWRDRVREARSELEALKTQREVAQKEYDTLRAELYVRSFTDPELDAKYRTRLAELDQQISQKEKELNTTLPDEARKAGIPPGVLNQ